MVGTPSECNSPEAVLVSIEAFKHQKMSKKKKTSLHQNTDIMGSFSDYLPSPLLGARNAGSGLKRYEWLGPSLTSE